MAVGDEAVGVGLLVSPVRRRIFDLLVAHAQAETNEEDASDSSAAGSAPDRSTGMTAADLAERMQLHVTTVRFHLDQLVAAGLLDAHSRRTSSVGRPRKLYSVGPGSLTEPESTDPRVGVAFQALAGLLVKVWTDPDGTPRTPEIAGREWVLERLAVDQRMNEPSKTPGQWLDKIGRTIDLLAEWGYTGEVATSQGGRRATIKLADCPFLDLARERPDVVCGLHRGLLAGAMLALGEGRPAISLQPFVAENECLAHLTRPPFDKQQLDRTPIDKPPG